MVRSGPLSTPPAALAHIIQSSRLPACMRAVTSVRNPVNSQCRCHHPGACQAAASQPTSEVISAGGVFS